MAKKRAYGPEPKEFFPRNMDKYKGRTPIILRSQLELRLAMWLDTLPICILWGYESNVVKYYDPVSSKERRYILDFYAIMLDRKTSKRTKYFIEVKPYKQTIPPKKGKRKKHTTLKKEVETYATNLAKWKSANAMAERNKCKFTIITEKELKL